MAAAGKVLAGKVLAGKAAADTVPARTGLPPVAEPPGMARAQLPEVEPLLPQEAGVVALPLPPVGAEAVLLPQAEVPLQEPVLLLHLHP